MIHQFAIIDNTALIGRPPEDRSWSEGDTVYPPIIGGGVHIEAFVTVDAGKERHTTIGPRTLLMKKVHIGHDAIVGGDCEIAPGAVVCGYAVIGRGVKIGCNAVINPYRMVGTNAQIGSGSVVTRDVPANEVWAGNPARKLR